MKLSIALAFVLAHCSVASAAAPDLAKTPGAIFPTCTAAMVCKPGYTLRARHVTTATKRRVCARYGILKGCPGPGFEVDHFVPLELCGSNDETNLWPEPIKDARRKDVIESSLHDEVCSGRRSLTGAQLEIRQWQ